MNDGCQVPPELATLYHVNRYMDANPGATYDEVLDWLNNRLPNYFAWAIVTRAIEQRIVERIYAGKAADA